jgi:formylglycine-generating enzyme required for sulfatase activity
VEHRSAQRHAFNLLKPMQSLAQSLEADKQSPLEVKIEDYFSFLGQAVQRAAVPTVPSVHGQDARQRQTVSDVGKLFSELVSGQAEVQTNLASSNELIFGQVLDASSVALLLSQLHEWMLALTSGDKETQGLVLILQGLRHLAPYIASEHCADFWNLVKDTEGYKPPSGEIGAEEFKDLDTIPRRELWADVRSTLGQDPRFEPTRFYLPKERFKGHDETQEPIPGFVRIPAGTYDLGEEGEGFANNPPYKAKIEHDYFLARTLTTVNQFAAFVDAKGYEDEKLWDNIGWQWRTGSWDSKVIEKEPRREYLTSRKPELRYQPMAWDTQREHGSRAVTQLNWFEARAYCNWLDAQMQNSHRSDIDSILRTFYAGESTKKLKIMLPSAMQWERAARAANWSSSDARQYPWGGTTEATAHLHANLRATGIGRATVVGLFRANPLGATDLAGNAWEWHDSFCQKQGLVEQGKRMPGDVKSLKTSEKWEECDHLALRGGSYAYTANDARNSVRFRDRPDLWSSDVGFRVVLSLD